MNNYIKMSPILGLAGFGGGAAALTFSGGAVAYPWGDRAINGGGEESGGLPSMSEYFDITTAGNASDFGTLTVSRYFPGCCSDATWAVFSGGKTDSQTDKEEMDYYTIASASSATDFGNLGQAADGIACTSDMTRGILANGTWYASGSGNQIPMTEIYYFTIQNATGGAQGSTFGNATQARALHGACSDGIYGVFAGGSYVGTSNSIMDYITIQTTGNAQSFGNLISGRSSLSGAGSATRGIFAGGWGDFNDMEYITIASGSNGNEFGDMDVARFRYGGITNGTRAVWTGGNDDTSNNPRTDSIEFVVIDTTSNGSNFGDLSEPRNMCQGASGNAS